MLQIKQTLWYFLTNSYVTLFAIFLLALVLLPIQIIVPVESDAPEKTNQFLIFVNSVMAAFIGVYFGGGLLKLKQFYLWSVNHNYRYCLIGAFLILLSIFAVLQALVMSVNLQSTKLLLFLPFCVAVFSSYMVLGKNYLHKMLIPTTLILIGQLHHLGVDHTLIMVTAITATCSLIYYLYTGEIQRSKPPKETLFEVGMGEPTVLPPITMKVNHFLGRYLQKAIFSTKKDIGWSISLPYFKLALVPLLYLFVIIPFSFFVDGKGELLEVFTVMMMASTLMSVVMECRQLLPQTRTIAHLFGGDKHQDLKAKILRSLDKTITLNCLVLVLSVLPIALLLSMEFNHSVLLLETLVVISVGISLSPLMLCLKWVNVSVQLVLIMCAFGGLIFLASVWLVIDPANSWHSLKTLGFASGLIALRFVTRRIFLNYPMEKLMVTK